MKEDTKMTSLTLTKHRTLSSNLDQFIKHLNTLTLTDIAKQYIAGQPLTNIDTNAILAAYKLDIAKKLPNFDQYLKAGIDLSTQMPDDEPSKAALDALVSQIKASNRFTTERGYISFDSTVGAFTVNATGKQALDNAVVNLTDEQERVYESVQALFKLLQAHSTLLPGKFLNTDLVNPITKGLNTESMVSAIVTNIK